MLGATERDFWRASGCGVKVTTSWLNVGVKFTIVWLSSMSAAVCAAEVAMLPASQACHLFARVNKQIDSDRLCAWMQSLCRPLLHWLSAQQAYCLRRGSIHMMRSFFWAQSTHQHGWQEPEQGLDWGMSPASLSLTTEDHPEPSPAPEPHTTRPSWGANNIPRQQGTCNCSTSPPVKSSSSCRRSFTCSWCARTLSRSPCCRYSCAFWVSLRMSSLNTSAVTICGH